MRPPTLVVSGRRASPGQSWASQFVSARKLLELHRTIDARDWEPPQQLLYIGEAVATLPRGMKIVMHVRREPRALFRMLKANGYDYRCRFEPAGHFEVTVWHAADTSAASEDLE